MHLLERSLADYGLYCAMPYMDEEIRACWEHTANKNWVQAHVCLTPQDSCSPPLFPGQGLCLNIFVSTSQGLVSCSGNVYEIGHLLMTVWPRIWNVMSAGESWQVAGTGRSTVSPAPSMLHSQEPENQMKSPRRGCQAHWNKKWQRQSVFCTY